MAKTKAEVFADAMWDGLGLLYSGLEMTRGDWIKKVSPLLVSFAKDELDTAWNEIQCCDDVRLDQGLAVAIGDLQKLREVAESQVKTLQDQHDTGRDEFEKLDAKNDRLREALQDLVGIEKCVWAGKELRKAKNDAMKKAEAVLGGRHCGAVENKP